MSAPEQPTLEATERARRSTPEFVRMCRRDDEPLDTIYRMAEEYLTDMLDRFAAEVVERERALNAAARLELETILDGAATPPPGDAGECDHHWIGGNDGSFCTKCKLEVRGYPAATSPGDAGERARDLVWAIENILSPGLKRDQTGSDYHKARAIALAALQSERTAAASQARRETIARCMNAARGEDANRGAANEIAAAYIQGRLDAASDIRALATPQESTS